MKLKAAGCLCLLVGFMVGAALMCIAAVLDPGCPGPALFFIGLAGAFFSAILLALFIGERAQ